MHFTVMAKFIDREFEFYEFLEIPEMYEFQRILKCQRISRIKFVQ